MKSFRMSRSTENRNARKAVDFRGGARGATRLTEGQRFVSGRHLRRAAQSRRSRVQAFTVQEDGSLGLPLAAADIDPVTRLLMGWRAG